MIVRMYAHRVATGAPEMAVKFALSLERKSLGKGGGAARDAHLRRRRSNVAQGQIATFAFAMFVSRCCWKGFSVSMTMFASSNAPFSAARAMQEAAQ